jgi:hypothetical protein
MTSSKADEIDSNRLLPQPDDIEPESLATYWRAYASAIERERNELRDSKRRALSLADERAKEANGLRIENERLRAQIARDRS